jgi:uncharacterized protein (TIGR02271 family)
MDDSKPTPVISKDGMRGTIVDSGIAEGSTTHTLVEFETGQRVLVPLDALTLQADGSYYYLALRHDELADGRSISAQGSDEPLVLPVIAERVVVEKNTRITGRVRISKAVHEREEVVDEPLLRRTVQVERVPINRVVEAEIPVRYDGDTIIVPVLEEVLVVEKRLMLKEELHITQHQEQIRQPQRIVLRNEDITVERIVPNDQLEVDPAEQA